MLSARSIYQEIKEDDRTFELFCSIAAKNERQGGWENERIASLTADPVLARKVARHGEDEEKHGRLFASLLKKRGLDTVGIPGSSDYCMILEGRGIGLSHERLHREEPLSDEELLRYLVHSRITEQRAAEEVEDQKKIFADDVEIGKAVRMIAEDEQNHLAYCHEELLRFDAAGHGAQIARMLREYATAEADTYRDVAISTMSNFGDLLGWPGWKKGILRFGIRLIWIYERTWGWRRMVRLTPPERKNAMGGEPAAAAGG